MKNKANLALHLAVGIFLWNSSVPQAEATTVTYMFVGGCSNCTGVGQAYLALADYTQGQAITSSNFVSFDYASNLGTISISPLALVSIGGTIPVNLPAAASVTIFGTNSIFLSQLNGQWCASNVSNSCSVSGPPGDFGFSGSYEPTPEPTTLCLVLASFAALGWARQRSLMPR